eukprot:5908025-Alexandrium_andersonii.AAC.1
MLPSTDATLRARLARCCHVMWSPESLPGRPPDALPDLVGSLMLLVGARLGAALPLLRPQQGRTCPRPQAPGKVAHLARRPKCGCGALPNDSNRGGHAHSYRN